MAGFETVVRPMVFPNIRPAPTRSLPPEDDPEQGKCTIGGGGGGIISISESGSTSGSIDTPKETERRVDVARVYQKQDDGTVNRDTFVDIEVANQIRMETNKFGSRSTNIYTYEPVKEETNIEIKEKDKIKRSEDR